ncbi:MAG: hypothetical protein K9I82_08170 [Chitinophagaceae bacterium]|nr:hypothetical protein [Chitinophagaceae bacterium]
MKKCILFAPLVSHATTGRISALVNAGFELSVVDISTRVIDFSLDIYPYNKISKVYNLNIKTYGRYYSDNPSYISRFIDILQSLNFLKENKSLLNDINNVLLEIKPDYIFTFYGPMGIHFSRLIYKLKINYKLYFICNLIPSTIISGNYFTKKLKKYFVNEFVDYRNWANKLDGIFCSSTQMVEFFKKKFGICNNRLFIFQDFHPTSFGNSDLFESKNTLNSSLIFLGAPERWGGQMDNINNQIIEIANNNINICISKNIIIEDNVNISKYSFFTNEDVFNGELSKFANKYKASLITYNIERRSERFISTLPTRFFSSLSAGLPLAVKSGLFDAVEQFVILHEIGFVYNDIQDLYIQLQDSKKMLAYRNNILSKQNQFTAEFQAIEINKLFNI